MLQSVIIAFVLFPEGKYIFPQIHLENINVFFLTLWISHTY